MNVANNIQHKLIWSDLCLHIWSPTQERVKQFLKKSKKLKILSRIDIHLRHVKILENILSRLRDTVTKEASLNQVK